MAKILLGVASSYCASFLKGQVAFLVEAGWEVVLISGPGEEIEALAMQEKATLYCLPFAKTIAPLTDFRCLVSILGILGKEKPDIVNAGNPKSGFLILLAAWLKGIPNRIFTLHGLVSDTRTGLKKRLILMLETISSRLALQTWVVSPSLRQHALEAGVVRAADSLVIGNGSCNGVDASRFKRSAAQQEASGKLRLQYGIAEDDIVIGFAGRLSKDKGIELLLRVFNTLSKQYPNLRLLLAGPFETNDPIDAIYTTMLSGNPGIIYLGKQADLVPVYGAMDIFVLPSYREGFGNVLIEAASMELPVIAPDIPGCRDAVSAGENGLLFKKGDENDLGKILETYVKNPHLRQTHGRNGRPRVIREFDPCTIWEAQLAIYRSLLRPFQG